MTDANIQRKEKKERKPSTKNKKIKKSIHINYGIKIITSS